MSYLRKISNKAIVSMEIQYYNNNNNNNNNNMKIIPLSFNIHQQNQYLYSIVSFQVWKPIVHIIKLPSLK